MIPPTSIDGTDITGATIDGTDVTEITVDGDTVFGGITVVDDFERTNLAHYSGSTSNYEISSVEAFGGSKSLKATETSGGNFIFSNSGLDKYPNRGDDFEIRVYLSKVGLRAITYFFGTGTDIDGGDAYELNYNGLAGADQQWQLIGPNDSDSVLYTPPTNEWLRWHFETTGTTIDFTLEEEDGTVGTSLQISDSSLNGTIIGFESTDDGSPVYFDEYVIL